MYGNSFNDCLDHIDYVLICYEENRLVLNWDKCHCTVNKGIVLGHVVSPQGIEFDNATVSLIKNLPIQKLPRIFVPF